MQNIINWFTDQWNSTFVVENRYKWFVNGFVNTMTIVFAAAALGILLGVLVAMVRVTHSQTERPTLAIRILNRICKIYLAIFRGTPLVIQLFLIYYMIFSSLNNALLAAIIGFGLNSGAYVAEIVRAGILAVDRGQMEAGRSLGLNYRSTMQLIVLPQAIKNILPALGNEFVTLIKETAVAGYITVKDFAMAGTYVRSRTSEAYFSLLFIAVVYFVVIWFFTKLFEIMERRLRKGDRH